MSSKIIAYPPISKYTLNIAIHKNPVKLENSPKKYPNKNSKKSRKIITDQRSQNNSKNIKQIQKKLKISREIQTNLKKPKENQSNPKKGPEKSKELQRNLKKSKEI